MARSRVHLLRISSSSSPISLSPSSPKQIDPIRSDQLQSAYPNTPQMELSLISDPTRYTHGLTTLQINSILAPPTIKPRTAPKKLARKRCRIKRSSKTDNNGGPYDGEGFFDGGDGPFGGGGGGGGRGGGDGFNWDESLPVEPTDPAFDFVYEVLCWIVLSNCLHFAFKKVFRIVSDSEREKVVSASFASLTLCICAVVRNVDLRYISDHRLGDGWVADEKKSRVWMTGLINSYPLPTGAIPTQGLWSGCAEF
nr:hypothetical protein [Tanacetum cinerariifolium]